MITLYINNTLADLKDGESIVIQKEFQDLEELVSKDITYSYDITLPITETNTKLFKCSNNIDTLYKFVQIFDAQLYDNEVLVINGKCIVNTIDEDGFHINLYVPAKKTITDILGDKQLNEIIAHEVYINDFNDIKRLNDDATDERNTELPHICYPYVLYGVNYSLQDQIKDEIPMDADARYYQSLDWDKCGFSLGNIYPAFNVLSVLKDVFKDSGYNLTGNVFKDKRFTGLWQTYSNSGDNYNTERQTPYYLSFTYSYSNRNSNKDGTYNISSTLSLENIYGDFPIGFDLINLSENTTFTNINDKYGMMPTSEAGTKTILIPQTGWYQISFNANINEVVNREIYRQDGRVQIAQLVSDQNRMDLEYSAVEVQILKGASPSAKYYTVNLALPTIPRDYNDDEVKGSIITDDKNIGCKLDDNDAFYRYPKNGGTTLIRDLSGFDTSEFVCCLRWGNQQVGNRHWSSRGAPERQLREPGTLDLPISGTHTVAYKDNTTPYYVLNTSNDTKSIENNYTYSYETAQIGVREDSYSNFEGYRLGERTYNNGKITAFRIKDDDYMAKSFVGQKNSSASTSTRGGHKTNGSGNANTCVWLEEGDILNIAAVLPVNTQMYYDDPDWFLDDSDWRDHGDSVIECKVNGNFSIGLISTKEDYFPSNANPIKTDAVDITTPRKTNINAVLPQIKCNEYLNGFLNTFNVRLTQISKDTFSLDANFTGGEMGNIIPIDDYANMESLTYQRLTLPSTINLKWKNDSTEEGYINGNNSPLISSDEANLDYNNPQHNGDKLFENPLNTSGDIDKKESQWSYCWYKTLRFLPDPMNRFQFTIDVPVVSDESIWSDAYDLTTAQSEDMQIDKQMRLFYINNKRIEIQQETIVPLAMAEFNSRVGTELSLVLPSNFLYTYKADGTYTRFALDFDNDASNKKADDTNITDKMWNINMKQLFQIEVECMLPNHIFNKINANTLISLNGGLYRIVKIEEHSLSHLSPTKLVLSSL